MLARLTHLRGAATFCRECLVLVAFWTLWLVLGLLLCIQIGIALSSELAVPQFVLRSIEAHFAASNVQARFGRAAFDPSGRILLEDLRIGLSSTSDPVVRARAVFVELDPWALLLGRVEPHRIQATGVTLYEPAMLSASGRNEEILSGLEFSVTPGPVEFRLEHLAARLAGVAVEAHGSFDVVRRPSAPGVSSLPLIEALPGHYAAFCHQFTKVAEQLAGFEEPTLNVTLVPSPTRMAIAHLALSARSVKFPRYHDLAVTGLRAATRVPLYGKTPTMSPVLLAVDAATTADGYSARGVRARVRGIFRPTGLAFESREIRLSAAGLGGRGFALQSLAARLEPGPLPRLAATAIAEYDGAPLAVAGHADFAQHSAAAHVEGALPPSLVDSVGALLHRDLHPFIALSQPLAFSVDASAGPGWKFERASGRLAVRQLVAHTVPMDYVAGEFEFDGHRFLAHHAVAVIGEDVARGTVEQDLATREYRFLLNGHLRPLDIGGWFHGWWEKVFGQFDFAHAPPEASVDVAGRWRAPHETRVFVFADATQPKIRGVDFDRARTLLFIRPHLIHGLEVLGTRGAGEIRGTFTRRIDLIASEWHSMEFEGHSTFDVAQGAKLLGPEIGGWLQPFDFAVPPDLTIAGRIDGPAAPEPHHRWLHVAGHSSGRFSLYRFPVQSLRFDATEHDDDLEIKDVAASVAGGELTGTASLIGAGHDRRLKVDAVLTDARLAQAVSALANYATVRHGKSSVSPSKLVSANADTTINAWLKAEGRFEDPYSFHGKGSAVLSGKELGEVNLLGALSQLLSFTSMRFTTAHADFTVDGAKLVFPAVTVTGANSAIEAHGTYALDRHELDFNARAYPFRESKSLLQSVAGAVLAPLSTALEVKLTGPIDQPNWAFVIGPTNLFKSLAQPAAPGDEQTKPAPPTPAPTAPPATTGPAPTPPK